MERRIRGKQEGAAYSREQVQKAASDFLQFAGHGSLDVSTVAVMTKAWGTIHPRVWRGKTDFGHLDNGVLDSSSIYGSVYTRAINAADSLYSDFESVARYVEPNSDNYSTCSHKLRELLILACTDIEANLKGILLANGYPRASHDCNTRDYIKLKAPLRLAEWEVSMPRYPELGTFVPFRDWDASHATQTLPFYNAYNAVKHDRDREFASANLKRVLESLAAVHILQCVQWGPGIYSPLFSKQTSPFYSERVPDWDLGDYYVVNPDDPDRWTQVSLHF